MLTSGESDITGPKSAFFAAKGLESVTHVTLTADFVRLSQTLKRK
jgi:hypothetical protein